MDKWFQEPTVPHLRKRSKQCICNYWCFRIKEKLQGIILSFLFPPLFCFKKAYDFSTFGHAVLFFPGVEEETILQYILARQESKGKVGRGRGKRGYNIVIPLLWLLVQPCHFNLLLWVVPDQITSWEDGPLFMHPEREQNRSPESNESLLLIYLLVSNIYLSRTH